MLLLSWLGNGDASRKKEDGRPMSALGDKDQRRIAMHNSDALQFANLQSPHFFAIRNEEGQDLVKVYFDGTLEFGENYKPDEAARCFWEAISLWAGNRDALLAEAAEVLREFGDYEPQDREYGDHCLYCDEYVCHKKTCPLSRAKYLLDKLGERE